MRNFLLPGVFLLTFVLSLNPLFGQCPEGHKVSLPDGSTSISFCQGQADGNVLVRSDIRGFPKAYVVTTSRGEIIEVTNRPRIHLDDLPAGVYRIYALVYAGRLQATVGQNIDEAKMSTFCWTFSDNFIEVVVAQLDDIELSYSDGTTGKQICPAAGDTLEFEVLTNAPDFALLLVDENNQIAAVSQMDNLSVDQLIEGDFQIFAIAYEGNLNVAIGDNFEPSELVDGCFALSDPVGLGVQKADGGDISFSGGETEYWLCPDGLEGGMVSVQIESQSSLPYYLLAVDEDQIIRLLEESHELDFRGLNQGNYTIYGFSAESVPGLMVGDTLDLDLLFGGSCYDASSTHLKVRFEAPNAGRITFSHNSDEVLFFCQDEFPDTIRVEASADVDDEYIFVAGNQDGEIIALSESGMFTGILDSGITVISGFSFRGSLLVGPGDNFLLDELSDDCFSPSDNQLYAIVDNPDGGDIRWNETVDTFELCSGDGRDAIVQMESESQSLFPYLYLVIDEENRLSRIYESDSINLEGLEGGIHRIIGFSTPSIDLLYEGMAEDSLFNICGEFSITALYLDVFEIFGGEVFLAAGRTSMTTCESLGQEKKIRIFKNVFSPVYQLFLVNQENEILRQTYSDSMDIGDLEVGFYKIYGAGSRDSLTAGSGDHIFNDTLGSECYSLSETYIKIVVDTVDGGMVMINGNDSMVQICALQHAETHITLSQTSTSPFNYRYLLIDEEDVLVEYFQVDSFSVSHLPDGEYRIQGISYGGNLLLREGDHMEDPDLEAATDCYDFSENSVQLRIDAPMGGEIAFSNGETTLTLCTDTTYQNADFQIVTPGQGEFFFAVINRLGVVVDTFASLEYDFSGLVPDIYSVAGIAHSGQGEVETGIGLDTMVSALGCYHLADGILQVSFATPDGGHVFDEDGNTEIDLEIGQNQPGIVRLENSSDSLANYIYAVTDSNDVIFFLLDEDELSVFTALFGELRVYGISYTGNLLLGNGQNVFEPASDGCYELSSNFLRITLIDADDLDDIPEPELSIELTGPNPVSGFLHFQVEVEPLSAQQIEWKILSSTGNVEAEGVFPVSVKTEEFQLDVSTFHPGIYFLVVRYDGMREVLKFVKH
ncbi:MAG: T9SS C-terminal target domain-containing protein [Saprospirales bacterium]|nr:MAG: T9SS C-terminal target domain-containing protein [Saprospirales bacterium]